MTTENPDYQLGWAVFKNEVEKWSRFFYFEIERAPSEIPANLPFWANFFALGSSNSKGACSISK
jgi:hypothetical protein